MTEESLAYILVTPAKNEGKGLPEMIKSISDQLALPIAWFIIDDGSNDNTFQIISKASEEYPWIHPLKIKSKGGYDIEEHYAIVCRIGFNFGMHFCRERKIPYEYIALSDADSLYPRDYFYRAINFLRDNAEYGIISGKCLIKDDKGITYQESKGFCDEGEPYGTGRVWRRKTFEETEGYMITKSPDTVSNIVAMLKGWKIYRLNDLKFYQTRETSTGGNADYWSGYYSRGRRYYFVGGNLLSLINNTIFLLLISGSKMSLTKSRAFFYGYIDSYIKRERRIDNEEVRKYMGSYRLVMLNYFKFAKHITLGLIKANKDD